MKNKSFGKEDMENHGGFHGLQLNNKREQENKLVMLEG